MSFGLKRFYDAGRQQQDKAIEENRNRDKIISDATKEFCEAGVHFRAAFRATKWVVMDASGFSHAFCDDEDAARAIAEALNEVLKPKDTIAK